MATVTGLTADRMQEIIDSTITDADIVGGHLILTLQDGSTIDTGQVSPVIKGNAFPGAPTDGDLFVRTDQVGDPLYKYTDGAWLVIGGGGITKASAFPTVPAPADGDMVVRTDQTGDPLYKFTDGVWELQPRMGAVNVPACSVSGNMGASTTPSNWRQLTIDAVSFDTNGMADIAGDTVVIKTPGLYMVEVRAVDNGVSTVGSRWLSLDLNGAGNGSNAIVTQKASEGGGTRLGSTVVRRYAAGDVLRVSHWHNADVALTSQLLELAVTWIGGAGQTVDERGVPATKVYNTAVQAIPNGVSTVVAFDAEIFDTDGMHDTVTNNSRITIKTPGLYSITAASDWAVNATGIRMLEIRKNGAGLPQEFAHQSTPSSSTYARQTMAVTLMLAAGDYIDLSVYQTSGSPLNLSGGAALSAVLIGSGKTVTPFVRAYKTASSQNINPDGAEYAITFDAEEVDNDGMHDNVTNNTRLTCRTAGIYSIRALISFAAASAGTRWLQIRKNGTITLEQKINDANANSTIRDTVMDINTVVELAVGDYLEITATVIDTGSPLSITGGQFNRGAKFSMVKIGAPIAGQTGIEVLEAITPVALLNGWVNAPAGRRAPGVYKDRGRVFLCGFMDGTAGSSNIAFNLPAAFRPATVMDPIPVLCVNALGNTSMVGLLTIAVNGDVSLLTSGGAAGGGNATTKYTQLEGISFRL